LRATFRHQDDFHVPGHVEVRLRRLLNVGSRQSVDSLLRLERGLQVGYVPVLISLRDPIEEVLVVVERPLRFAREQVAQDAHLPGRERFGPKPFDFLEHTLHEIACACRIARPVDPHGELRVRQLPRRRLRGDGIGASKLFADDVR
jgi:hypothetical protein